jgi:hypothetical protein
VTGDEAVWVGRPPRGGSPATVASVAGAADVTNYHPRRGAAHQLSPSASGRCVDRRLSARAGGIIKWAPRRIRGRVCFSTFQRRQDLVRPANGLAVALLEF